MKVLIDIPSNYKKRIDEDFNNLNTGSIGCTECMMAIKNGTPIPDNATNGDVLKTVFPYHSLILNNEEDYILFIIENSMCCKFTLDWWNAPYKGVK